MMDDGAETTIERWERLGNLDPNCKFCQERVYPKLYEGRVPFAPPHKPSTYCESGKRPHCTCNYCF